MVMFNTVLHSIHTGDDSYTRCVRHTGIKTKTLSAVCWALDCILMSPLQSFAAGINSIAQSAWHPNTQQLISAAGILKLV